MKLYAALACGLLLLATGAHAQRLPATAPTLPPPTLPPPAQAPPPSAPVPPSHRARVQYAGRRLEVTADNSSLNQILREVSRLTGMKITGGVTDERVYGTYGPAEPSAVLATLLNGTGSNMLLILDRNEKPSELVLTPRQGGATPPGPSAGRAQDDEDPDTPPQLSPRIDRRPAPVAATPPDAQPTQAPPPPESAPVAPAASTTTTEQSPNGVKTPEQIYEQLMKLQQQQTKTPQ